MNFNSSSRADKELEELYRRHVDTVYRLCYMYLKNAFDAEDAVSTVFLKLIKAQKEFHDYEHEKAWLISTAKNTCKDILKHWWKSRRVDMENLPEVPAWDNQEQENAALSALLSLPEKYKTVMYLYYYEGYTIKEISGMLNRKESTLQTQLSKGRQLLRTELGGYTLE
ncbi:MAG: sigma-70 family RNA polymerase sigma factor [Oscillospiraceae bacterium]|nr:sigma-70 family RNA polymerase sigma factor [Oscillospiraceae bacterium]